jgi:hypothetical protein
MPGSTLSAASARPRLGPFFALLCGLLLMFGAAVLYLLEPGPPAQRDAEAQAAEAAAASAVRALERTRQREAEQRADFERAAVEQAAERARRNALQADAIAEAEARRQREDLARKQAAADESRRAKTEHEEAWKRFYRPSERCSSPEGATSVECVNEFVKARREFAARNVGR